MKSRYHLGVLNSNVGLALLTTLSLMTSSTNRACLTKDDTDDNDMETCVGSPVGSVTPTSASTAGELSSGGVGVEDEEKLPPISSPVGLRSPGGVVFEDEERLPPISPRRMSTTFSTDSLSERSEAGSMGPEDPELRQLHLESIRAAAQLALRRNSIAELSLEDQVTHPTLVIGTVLVHHTLDQQQKKRPIPLKLWSLRSNNEQADVEVHLGLRKSSLCSDGGAFHKIELRSR